MIVIAGAEEQDSHQTANSSYLQTERQPIRSFVGQNPAVFAAGYTNSGRVESNFHWFPSRTARFYVESELIEEQELIRFELIESRVDDKLARAYPNRICPICYYVVCYLNDHQVITIVVNIAVMSRKGQCWKSEKSHSVVFVEVDWLLGSIGAVRGKTFKSHGANQVSIQRRFIRRWMKRKRNLFSTTVILLLLLKLNSNFSVSQDQRGSWR